MILGVLTIFFGIIWIPWPLLGYAPSTFINVYPVAPQPDQRCYGVLVPFPYLWSCPPNYERLPSPFDVLPILTVIYFGIGGATIGTALTQKLRRTSLLLSLSTGLVVTGLTSNFGSPGGQGWPINWFLYPISHPPGSTYFPVYIVIPAFLADWTMFSIAVGLIWILPALSGLLKRR